MTAKNPKDLRKSERLPAKLQVDCKSEGIFMFENATNISEHGVFIHTQKPLKEGTSIETQFAIPESKDKITVVGKVMWVNPMRKEDEKNYNPGMGIRFENLSEVDREILLNSIKRIAVL